MKIVVGIDGSQHASAALDFACTEAELHDAELVIVHAWTYPYLDIAAGSAANAFEGIEPAAQAVLDEATAAAAKRCGGRVNITGKLVQGSAAAGLLDEDNGADLIVVGSRGHGGFASLLLGSTSQQVCHHASVPVVIVRERQE